MADPHVKHVRALHQKKQREALGLFLVQGRKTVRELMASGLRIDSIHATAEAARELGLEHAIITSPEDLERMGTLEHGNEVIAVVHMPPHRSPVPPADGELVLALDGISDPGNMGTLLRIADWFGIRQVWCSEDCVEVFNPKCVQASMGSLFRVTVSPADLFDALGAAHRHGARIYKADAAGANVHTAALERPAVLVMGSESHGLRGKVREAPGALIAVPRFGKAESLNVSAAAAALCMEFARRS